VASELGRSNRIPRENVRLFLLATSTAGDARMRTFSRERVDAWLEEDQIDGQTRSRGEEFLSALQDQAS
jgi:hypothetical protein